MRVTNNDIYAAVLAVLGNWRLNMHHASFQKRTVKGTPRWVWVTVVQDPRDRDFKTFTEIRGWLAEHTFRTRVRERMGGSSELENLRSSSASDACTWKSASTIEYACAYPRFTWLDVWPALADILEERAEKKVCHLVVSLQEAQTFLESRRSP